MIDARRIALATLAVLLASCAAPVARVSPLDRIDTIVVIYAENHSFDNMYGLFPGADGIANATAEQKTQFDHDGTPLPHLPPVYSHGKPDPKYPSNLPNGPFRIDLPPVNRSIKEWVPSPTHLYWHHIEQINGGRNNKFVAMSERGAWTMGYYDGSVLRMWEWARRYTLADKFFQGAFGGSFLNHQWLICACTPVFPEAPAAMRAQLDANGLLKRKPDSPPSVLQGPVRVFDGEVSPDGFAVNAIVSMQPAYQPSGIPPAQGGNLDLADPTRFPLTPQTARTIGDTLSAKGVSWRWYAGLWNLALEDGRRDASARRRIIYNNVEDEPSFAPHHQPFNYFARFAPGSPDRAEHLKDGEDFISDIALGRLPQVAFYKPALRLTQHPGGSIIFAGDLHISDILTRLEKSPQWPHMLVIVTYDENGGYWDHVPPPAGPGWGDRWGPGSRVPTIIVSPFAKRGFVDHTSYDTTSILKLITERFALEPLAGVREKTGDLTNALQ